MKKKITGALSMLLILLLLPVSVFAASDDGQLVQAYCHEGTLYTYANMPRVDSEQGLTAAAAISNSFFPNTAVPIEIVSQTEQPVYYMIMVDISTSMPPFKENINAFADSMMSESGENAKFQLATFGSEFSTLGEFTSDRDEFLSSVRGLAYNASQTSLYAGIADAIDYLESLERDDGGMYNIIIVSDGIEIDKDGPTYAEIEKKITESTVTLHTVGFKCSDSESESALKNLGAYARASSGIHSVFGYDSNTEESIAKGITDFVNGLSYLEFDISSFNSNGGRYTVTVSIYDEKTPVFSISKENVKIPAGRSITPPSSETSLPDASNQENAQPQDEANAVRDVSSNFALSKWLLFLIIGGAGLLLIIILVLLIVRRRNHTGYTASQPHGIFMKLEVIDGVYAGKNDELYLTGELIVGRDKSCGIQFKDKDVSERNSRIFILDNIIYIEDLSSKNGTAISGMKIFSPNRLRSGDIITIGDVKFKLKF